MNEIEIIRSQLALEQSHAAQAAQACAAVLSSSSAPPNAVTVRFRDACVSYLVWVLARFEERDQALAERLTARGSGGGTGAASSRAGSLGELLARPGRSREALSRLESALAAAAPQAAARWQEFDRFFNSAWTSRRAALEAALAERCSIADWRAVCAIDADAIVDERNRFARVRAELPAGVELGRTPRAGST